MNYCPWGDGYTYATGMVGCMVPSACNTNENAIIHKPHNCNYNLDEVGICGGDCFEDQGCGCECPDIFFNLSTIIQGYGTTEVEITLIENFKAS